ncbi:MAG: hypothetical protein RL204_1640 [Bacteroidota bacterium]|jgi:cytochrome c peroxidase
MTLTGKLFFFWCIILLSVLGCTKESTEDPQASFKGLVVPSHFPQPHYQFENNPLTSEGFELGRKLFYDPILSVDSTISCASCHAQVHGFADHGIPVSHGIYGRQGKRNSLALFNLAWTPAFMWDGGINHIEVMPIAPLTDTLEMGETMAHLVVKLSASSTYPDLFGKAFGSSEITDQKLLFALAQYMSMIVSTDSKYDRMREARAAFTVEEQQGYEIYQSKCSSCHVEPLFTDFSYRNNGLDETFTDLGRKRITLNDDDLGKFKVPSLRNLAFTYPYMHDGRFNTLNKVLDHYDHQIVLSNTLDPALVNGIPLTDEERVVLIAFLNTLNDYTFLSDRTIAEP